MSNAKNAFSSFADKWKNHGPAARPMKSELAQIEKYIKSLPAGKMLVLGATPEYRDIGIRNGWETHAFDINPNIDLLQNNMSYCNSRILAANSSYFVNIYAVYASSVFTIFAQNSVIS